MLRKSDTDNVSLKDYLDKIFELNEKALNKAFAELADWKNLHNNLQRKLDEQQKEFDIKLTGYVSKDDQKATEKVWWTRIVALCAIFSLIIAILGFIFLYKNRS